MSIQPLNGNSGNAYPLPSSPQAGTGTPPAAATSAPQVSQPQQQQAPAPTAQQVQEAAKAVERVVQPKANALQFSVDQSTGQTVVRIVDGGTGDVIRQIPSEEILKIAQSIDQFQGILGKVKA
jgi:flagellar protein FlaG